MLILKVLTSTDVSSEIKFVPFMAVISKVVRTPLKQTVLILKIQD